MATSSAVKVCVRLRPLNKREKRGNTIPVVTANTEKGEINVVKGLSTKATRHGFNFDNVFSEFATQEEVFNWLGKLCKYCITFNTVLHIYMSF